MIKHIISLTKPGIIFGNLLTASAGFWFGFHILHMDFTSLVMWLFLATMAGIALVIASGCAFNNYIDCDIDALMQRTKNRVLVTGVISKKTSLVVGAVCLILGLAILFFLVNTLCCLVTAIGFVFYVICYSLYFKRHSVYGTVIGSISGAAPPVAGICAITNSLSVPSIILFMMLVVWQIPHFYAIAIYRHDDYKNASIPVLPVVGSIDRAKIYMKVCILLFMAFGIMLWINAALSFGYINYLYLLILLVSGFYWLKITYSRKIPDAAMWARKVFFASLVVITCVSVALVW